MNRSLLARTLALGALAVSVPALAGYEASSTKRDSRMGDNAFAIAQALDSNLATTWQCDPEKDNVGQWLELDVPAAEIDKIAMVIGWDKSEDTFKDYARVKSATAVFFSKTIGGEKKQVGEAKLSFADERGWQVLDVPDLKIDGELGGTVRITINEVYPGVDYPNLAVSELRIHLKEFPAESATFASDITGSDPKHEAIEMLDGSEKTWFVAQGTSLTFTAKAPGYGLASIGLAPGPATHARPKTVVLKANNNETKHEIPESAKGMQWLLLPAIIGYTGGAWGDVVVEIQDTWPGTVATNPLALSEFKMNAGTIEEF